MPRIDFFHLLPPDWGSYVQFCCRSLQQAEDKKEKAAQVVLAKAKAMALALQTIGKFTIKKRVGVNNHIHGR